jgi:hypothetical protein
MTPFEVGSAFDDFDGDLLKLVPQTEQMEFFHASKSHRLYVFGSTDQSRTKLVHPAVWNGPGALFFTKPPEFVEDSPGWRHLANACVTNDPLLVVTLFDVIRDAWCHHYSAQLNYEPWFRHCGAAENNDTMMRLLSLRRGWGANMPGWPAETCETAAVVWIKFILRRYSEISKRPLLVYAKGDDGLP